MNVLNHSYLLKFYRELYSWKGGNKNDLHGKWKV
jgi:hypothetical protein